MMFRFVPVLVATVIAVAAFNPRAAAQGWPEVFNPMQVLTLNLQMSPEDWSTVQADLSFSIEVPAMFWADGEQPILVSVRRKSADPLQNGTPYAKVSLKIDINEYVAGQRWRDLNKLSLENGDDQDVISEGFAWHLHRLASGPEGYDYQHPAALAAWVRLIINGVDTGVYLSAEQRDTRFLRNRGLYTAGQTWLYEVEDPGQLEIETGSPHSPTVLALCYRPFEYVGAQCPTPDAATLAAQLPQLVNMRSLLTMGAVNALLGANDSMLPAGKNFFFADFQTGRTRMYFPWDLDSVMGGNAGQFYETRGIYGATLLNVPQFRAQYSQIMNDLLCGPFQTADLLAFLDAVEASVGPALAADPNNQLGGQSVAEFFNNRRNWISNRLNVIAGQIEGFVPCGQSCPADWNGDNVVNSGDISAFLTDWLDSVQAGTLVADFNGDGAVNSSDISAFIAAWLAAINNGC